jgi:hypothetical protein
LFAGLQSGRARRESTTIEGIDDDASQGRPSSRNSRMVMPPGESLWVFPKLLSRSMASTTSGAGGNAVGLSRAAGRCRHPQADWRHTRQSLLPGLQPRERATRRAPVRVQSEWSGVALSLRRQARRPVLPNGRK